MAAIEGRSDDAGPQHGEETAVVTGQRPRGELWLVRMTLLVLSTALTVLFVEAALRVAGYDRPLMWRPDPVLGWWHIPESKQQWREEGDAWVEINRLGMRDRERTIDKPAGVFRIAVFGDSMTEGVQVNLEQTFTQLLEKRLLRRGLRAEVLNFGVNGYSPLQEYLLYTQYGRRFDADLLLHAVFLDNDVADGLADLAAGQAGAPFVTGNDGLSVDYSRAEASDRDYRREPIHTFRRLSATYRVISASRWDRIRQATFQQALAANDQIPKRYLLYADPPPSRWEDAWNVFERVVTAFEREVRSDGAAYALISVPAGQVVRADVWEGLLAQFPAMRTRQWRLKGPEERLREFATARMLPLLIAGGDFRRAHERPLFFGSVGHLTADGHEVMAQALERFLLERQLVPHTP